MELSPGCRVYGFSGDVDEVDVLRRLPRTEFARRCHWRGNPVAKAEKDTTLAMILHDQAQERLHGHKSR